MRPDTRARDPHKEMLVTLAVSEVDQAISRERSRRDESRSITRAFAKASTDKLARYRRAKAIFRRFSPRDVDRLTLRTNMARAKADLARVRASFAEAQLAATEAERALHELYRQRATRESPARARVSECEKG